MGFSCGNGGNRLIDAAQTVSSIPAVAFEVATDGCTACAAIARCGTRCAAASAVVYVCADVGFTTGADGVAIRIVHEAGEFAGACVTSRRCIGGATGVSTASAIAVVALQIGFAAVHHVAIAFAVSSTAFDKPAGTTDAFGGRVWKGAQIVAASAVHGVCVGVHTGAAAVRTAGATTYAT